MIFLCQQSLPTIFKEMCLTLSQRSYDVENGDFGQHPRAGVGKKPGSDWLGFSNFKKFIKSKKLAGFFGEKN